MIQETTHHEMVNKNKIQKHLQFDSNSRVFPGGSDSKETACNAGDLGSILGWGDPLEESTVALSTIYAWRIP